MKSVFVFIVLNALTIFLTIGCGDVSTHSNNDDHVIKVKAEDAEMNIAINEAQSTLTNFIAALCFPKPNQKFFLVNGRFTSGGAVEHIWVADVTYDWKTFKGVIANEPEIISGFYFKKPVEVKLSQVSDWMFVQDGKLVGGYTSRLLRNRMTEQERRELDAQTPYSFN